MFIFLMIFGGFFTIIGLLNIANDVDIIASVIFLIMGIAALAGGLIFNYYKEKRAIITRHSKELANIVKKHENRMNEIEHSPEAYLTYINLKDYPKSRNPFWKNDQLYESIILFIRHTYATCKNITHEEPFIVDTIQFANLVRSELPKDTILSEEVFLCTLEAYASYYLTINEEEIYYNIVKDFNNDDILVSDIIFKMRQKYIKEFQKSSFNEEPPITPNLAEILAEVFTEKNITPQL